MKILVKALHEDTEFKLELELLAGEQGLSRAVQYARIQRPGLAMAGLAESIRPERVQVLGNTEVQYLLSLGAPRQQQAVDLLFGAHVCAVVVTAGMDPVAALLEAADQFGVALFRTPLSSSTFINRAHRFLDEHLSPELSLHGVLVDVFGVGVLLTGQSGIGKSESALDLILRGHRLVSDDVVTIRRHDRELVGVGSPLTQYHMELRGLGIINVRHLFGAASVCDRKTIDLVVEMAEWRDGAEYDRTGIGDASEVILETRIPKVCLPIRPGRNVAAIIEVAARNHLLKLQGHHSAKEFKESLENRLATIAEQAAWRGEQ